MKLKTEVWTEVNSHACINLKDTITQKKENIYSLSSQNHADRKFRVPQPISGASRQNSFEAFS